MDFLIHKYQLDSSDKCIPFINLEDFNNNSQLKDIKTIEDEILFLNIIKKKWLNVDINKFCGPCISYFNIKLPEDIIKTEIINFFYVFLSIEIIYGNLIKFDNFFIEKILKISIPSLKEIKMKYFSKKSGFSVTNDRLETTADNVFGFFAKRKKKVVLGKPKKYKLSLLPIESEPNAVCLKNIFELLNQNSLILIKTKIENDYILIFNFKDLFHIFDFNGSYKTENPSKAFMISASTPSDLFEIFVSIYSVSQLNYYLNNGEFFDITTD